MSADVDRSDVVADLDADEARAITDRIRGEVDTLWQLIAQAYFGRAWLALQYPNWDLYCATEFAGARLRLPRQERIRAVSSLRDAGLSIRGIAAATGIDKNTVQTDLAQLVSEIHTPDPADEDTLAEELITAELAPVIGLDGKTYAAKPNRQQPDTAKRKPSNTVDARFYRHLSQLQSCALKLEMLTKESGFAAHIEELCHQHRDGVVWAQEILARVLDVMHTDQGELFADTDRAIG